MYDLSPDDYKVLEWVQFIATVLFWLWLWDANRDHSDED